MRNDTEITGQFDSTLIRDWAVELKLAGKSRHTLTAYKQAANSYLSFSGGDISRSTVRGWLDSISGMAPSSRQTYLSIVRIFLSWLIDEGELTADPSVGLKTAKVTTPPVNPLAADELAAILRVVQGDNRDEAIMHTLMSTGMRISECAGMLLDNTDLEKQEALIFGKGAKWRTVHLDDQACRSISRYIRQDRRKHRYAALPQLWLCQRGAFHSAGLDAMIRRAAERAGVKDLHAHRFRHTFADQWLSEGRSESGLMTLAGWTSRAMVDRYSKGRATERALDEAKLFKRGAR
jgi:site-specific recombinase XerD